MPIVDAETKIDPSIVDLLAHVEALRMEVRDAVSLGLRSKLKNVYPKAREIVLASSITREHAPDWLRMAGNAARAADIVASLTPNDGHFIKARRRKIEEDLAPMALALREAAIERREGHRVVEKMVSVRIEKFLGRKIDLEDRAAQVLTAAVPGKDNPVSPVWALWSNSIMLFPAIAFSVETALNSPTLYREMLDELTLRQHDLLRDVVSDHFLVNVLNRCLYERRSNSVSAYGKDVLKSGRLTTIGLLRSTLEPPIGSYGEYPPLKVALRNLVGAEHPRLFKHLLNTMFSAFDLIQHLDPSSGDQQFSIFLDGPEVRIRPCGTWAYCREPNAQSGQSFPFRGTVVQPSGPFSDESLARLEWMINANSPEGEFQKFFEVEPAYLAGLGNYSTIHPQLVLTDDDGRRLIPDFFLENFHTGFLDICDLKRPSDRILKEVGNRPQFRDRIATGIRQLSSYRDYFEDRDNRRRFEKSYPGLRAFRPRVILVIGRKEDSVSELTRMRLESELRDWVTLHTYDDIVASAREWRRRIS